MAEVDRFSQALVKLAEVCNSFILPGSSKNDCCPFLIDGRQVGMIREDIWKHLKGYTDVFVVTVQDGQSKKIMTLNPAHRTVKERSRAVAAVLEDLRDKDVCVTLRGWRDENCDVRHSITEPVLLRMERAATSLFGMVQYGTHINGYRYKEGELMMWIGRRSKTKQTYPGMLDNMCAGCLSTGLGVRECAMKECQEEGSVPTELFTNLQQTGCISYCFEDDRGVFPECEFTFDLLLPDTFTPVNADGEVSHFELMSMDKIKELIISEEFKPNSALVIVDFMIRHGLITIDNEPRLCYLVEMLHAPLQKYDAIV